MRGSTLLLLMAVTLLAGCQSAPQRVEVPYEVKVPTYIKRTPPGELVRPYVPTELPKFIAPGSPSAVYGLTQQDWERLQVILRTLHTRDAAWRAWSTEGSSK